MKNVTRQIWLVPFAALTICALLACALAEEVYAKPTEVVVVENEEGALEQDESGSLSEGYANIVYEGEEEFYVPEEIPMTSTESEFVIENGVLTNYIGNGEEVVIPDGVISIGEAAFFERKSILKKVTFPSTLVSIGERAFWLCEKLENFTLPSSLRTIGYGAFVGCDSLTSVTIPDGVTTIDECAFYKCKNLTEVTIAGTVKELKRNVFEGCLALMKVVLQDGITTLGEYAFWDCIKLESIVIPNSVSYIDLIAIGHWDNDTKTYTTLAATISTPCGSYAQKWATENGYKCEISAHNPVTDPAVAPTYTAAGLTEGSHCASCGTVFVAQQEIPALAQPLVLSKVKNNGNITMSVGDKLRVVSDFATSSGWTVNGYKSSKPAIVSIDGNGLFTANAEGSAKITVTTAQKKSATVTVKVIDPYKPTAIAIAQGKAITITMGQPLQLNVALAPKSARATLTWTSSKGKVATVDGNGLVTPVGEGKTKITVKTQNKKKATITVQVVDSNKPLGIAIAQGKAVTVSAGQTLQLTVGLNPAAAQSALTWKTNKAAIATVDANGLVTAVKKGKAKITVTTYNKKKATITVNVVP